MPDTIVIISINFILFVIALVLFFLSFELKNQPKEYTKMNKRYELNARVNYDGAPDFTDEVERDLLEGYVYAENEKAAIERGMSELVDTVSTHGYRSESDGQSVSVYNEDGELIEIYYDFSVTLIK